MDLTIYILTHICQDCQYEPQVFLSKAEATQAMLDKYTALKEATFKQWAAYSSEWAKIIYQDQSFDEFEIYTINIHDNRIKV